MVRVLMLLFYSSLLLGCQKSAQEVLQLTQEASYSASLSQDAKLAIVSTARQGVQVWDLEKNAIRYTWHQGEGKSNVIATALSANSAYAATLTNQSLGLWSLATGKSVGWWSLPASGQTVAVANTGQVLVGLVDGSVLSLAHDRQSLIKFLGHTEKVTSVSVSADGQYALSGGNDAQVILWHAQTGQPIHRWLMKSRVTKVLLNDDASISFASDIMGNASLWNSQSGKLKTQLDIKRRQMTFSAARFIDQDKYLLTGTPSKEVFLWDSKTGKKIARRQVQVTKDNQNRGAVVYSVARQSPSRLVSISSQGLLESWDITH